MPESQYLQGWRDAARYAESLLPAPWGEPLTTEAVVKSVAESIRARAERMAEAGISEGR